MDEQQWARYLYLLAGAQSTLACACVGCWYEQQPAGSAFPGDRVSSTLCQRHRIALPVEIKQSETLVQRSYA